MRRISFPSYARRLAKRNLIAAGVCALLSALCWTATYFLKAPTLSPYAWFGCLVFFAGVSAPLMQAIKAWQGAVGESHIEEELEPLGADYVLVKNWVPVEKKGDVDLLLLGPHGVLVIEVKNYAVPVKCEGDRWSIQRDNGSLRPIKSISSQLRGNIQRTNRALNVRARGVIIFNERAKLTVTDARETVLKRTELIGYVRSLPRVSQDLNALVARVEALLPQD